jgi:heterotetrameric sarcosine oxidase gamma subunit
VAHALVSAAAVSIVEFERIEPPGRAIEVVVLRPSAPPSGADWALPPGRARRDSAGRVVVLRVAPDRYFLPEPDRSAIGRVQEAVAAKACALIDVSGKWECFRFSGACARRVLSAAVNLEALFDARDCASTVIFDCPVIIAQEGEGYRIWVARSFAAALSAAVAAQLMTL